jgi:Flp pilus assembly protein TadB
MIKVGYLQSRRLTPLEVGIWFSALIVAIILGILFVTKVVGTWVVLIPCGLAMGVGLMRYRAETEQKKRNADDRDE